MIDDPTTRNVGSGICECGCEGVAPISPITSRGRGYVKGTPRRFIHGHYGRSQQIAQAPRVPPSETDHAWAAGIIDGEGCIQINRSRLGHRLYLTVGQSGQRPGPMLRRLQALYGGRIHEHRHTSPNSKPHFVWGVVARQAEETLRAVRAYAVEKLPQIEVALSFRETAVGVGKRDAAEWHRARLREIRAAR